ncbi:thioester domain-containing protein [Saccharothrix syringae]|uniref:TQXA domain-containing protein n=1 Tax=Saccharothrix syringae TaxID=103733 RepID=A0A5Q0GQM7_SACSY|nr:thioester domain-containing protein [Saccharothrix syringae]QFZ16233.1 TQXA domain-containing protein [Saccharothrix syringae]
MASRLTSKRIGTAVLGASVVLTTAALPALADAVEIIPIERHVNGKDNPEFFKHHEEGIEVGLKNQGRDWFDANLIPLYVVEDGEKTVVKAYCVELPTVLKDGTKLHEVPWDKHPNPKTKFTENAAKVNWILHHSYPQLDVSALSTATGRDIEEREAIAATQAAIWHFSDGVDLKTGADATKDDRDEVDQDVRAVYDYLTGSENVGEAQAPAPTLKIEAPEVTAGEAGGKLIGPFKITTTAASVTLEVDAPAGVTLTDKDGTPLPQADGGFQAQAQTQIAEVYVKVAAGTPAGEVEFSVKADAQLQHGRLFVSVSSDQKTQSLVIAKQTQVAVEADAKASWTASTVVTTTTTPAETTSATPTTTTEAPTTTTTSAVASSGGNNDDLASTGASIFVPLLVGLGLLGAGAAALLVVRRKRTA